MFIKYMLIVQYAAEINETYAYLFRNKFTYKHNFPGLLM